MFLISGQKSRDQNTINRKMVARDFDVLVSPRFNIGDTTYQVILDGHHAYDAAIQANVIPNYIIASQECLPIIRYLDDGEVYKFLDVCLVDLDHFVLASSDTKVIF